TADFHVALEARIHQLRGTLSALLHRNTSEQLRFQVVDGATVRGQHNDACGTGLIVKVDIKGRDKNEDQDQSHHNVVLPTGPRVVPKYKTSEAVHRFQCNRMRDSANTKRNMLILCCVSITKRKEQR